MFYVSSVQCVCACVCCVYIYINIYIFLNLTFASETIFFVFSFCITIKNFFDSRRPSVALLIIQVQAAGKGTDLKCRTTLFGAFFSL